MSVIKYTIKKTGAGFTTIPNRVIQSLGDATALGVYVYMQSLPQEWEFHKSQLRSHFDIGIHKINAILKLLEAHRLINIVQIRNKNGQYDRADIEVNDGSDFVELPLYSNRVTETVLRLSATIKETPTKQTKKKTNRAIAKPVDNSAVKAQVTHKSAPRSSDCLTKLPEDFCPDADGIEQLYKTASKVNMPTTKLTEKFKEVCLKYKTRSADWQKTFVEFLLREKPKRTFEDSSGKRRRYDGGEIYN